ncbi:MAG TPA: nuclear transport factor 2 family protein [Baekduia sp.]
MELAVDSPLAAYRTAFLAGDLDAAVAAMRPDVVLSSPITNAFRFTGRAQLRDLLEDVRAVVADSEYTHDVGDDRTRVLRYSGRVGRQPFDETMVVVLDDDGLIASMELFIRPLPGLTALAAALGPRVARRRSRVRAAVVRGMIGPLALVTARAEGTGARLAAP